MTDEQFVQIIKAVGKNDPNSGCGLASLVLLVGLALFTGTAVSYFALSSDISDLRRRVNALQRPADTVFV